MAPSFTAVKHTAIQAYKHTGIPTHGQHALTKTRPSAGFSRFIKCVSAGESLCRTRRPLQVQLQLQRGRISYGRIPTATSSQFNCLRHRQSAY